MSKIIKVRCNGPDRHTNEIDLDKALRSDIALKGRKETIGQSLPERLIFPCRICTDGRVIITKKMIEENQ